MRIPTRAARSDLHVMQQVVHAPCGRRCPWPCHQRCCLEVSNSGHAGDICNRSLHCIRAAQLCCKLSFFPSQPVSQCSTSMRGSWAYGWGAVCALSTMSGSGRQCFAGGHGPPPQCTVTPATWLRWCCLFAGASPDQAPGGGPAQSPGGNYSSCFPARFIAALSDQSQQHAAGWQQSTDVFNLYQAVLVSL